MKVGHGRAGKARLLRECLWHAVRNRPPQLLVLHILQSGQLTLSGCRGQDKP